MTETSIDQTTQNVIAPSAEIIPFRVRAQSPAAPRPFVSAEGVSAPAQMTLAQQRLARALETLNTALIDQRQAMAAWRSSLADLKTSTTGLGDSLERYRANLASLGQGVASLRAQAKTLRDWADKTAAE